MSELLRTPLFDAHVAAGGKMVPFAGYELPVQYKFANGTGGLVDEHRTVRTAAGLFDVSHMGELRLEGAGAGAVVDYAITNDAAKLVDGQALYTCACNAEGTILDDLIVYRRSVDAWLIVCNASNRSKMVAHFAELARKNGACAFEDISDKTALIAFQGPKAVAIAERLGGVGLTALGSFHFRGTTIAGVTCTAARTGYTGEDGLEIFCSNEDAPKLWAALYEGGASEGVTPAGLGARDTLRLEARLSLYGNDIDETTNPLEAGLGWVVKLGKSDFLGKAALVAIKERGLPRKLVGFEMTGRGIARHGYPLHAKAGGAAIGVCTSGSPGPSIGKSVGLGYVPAELAEIGTEIVVDCRGRMTEAVVTKTPFYKRPKA